MSWATEVRVKKWARKGWQWTCYFRVLRASFFLGSVTRKTRDSAPPRPSHLHFSIHSLYNCVLARCNSLQTDIQHMIKRRTDIVYIKHDKKRKIRKKPVCAKIREPVNQRKSKTDRVNEASLMLMIGCLFTWINLSRMLSGVLEDSLSSRFIPSNECHRIF